MTFRTRPSGDVTKVSVLLIVGEQCFAVTGEGREHIWKRRTVRSQPSLVRESSAGVQSTLAPASAPSKGERASRPPRITISSPRSRHRVVDVAQHRLGHLAVVTVGMVRETVSAGADRAVEFGRASTGGNGGRSAVLCAAFGVVERRPAAKPLRCTLGGSNEGGGSRVGARP